MEPQTKEAAGGNIFFERTKEDSQFALQFIHKRTAQKFRRLFSKFYPEAEVFPNKKDNNDGKHFVRHNINIRRKGNTF
jgi:hypothetical protein